MKIINLRSALQGAILVMLFTTVVRAESAETTTISPQKVRAKMSYCEICHGPTGRGFRGYYPIPRLAGQQTAYFENQLKGFAERKRTNPIMLHVAHALSPAMIDALAKNFYDLNPKPVDDAPKELVSAGKTIFTEGIPAATVPPCASCHGPNAKGNGQFPRLAGQLYSYVVNQLTNWRKERAEENSAIMAPIAHSLTQPQIKAVAAYVSNLEVEPSGRNANE